MVAVVAGRPADQVVGRDPSGRRPHPVIRGPSTSSWPATPGAPSACSRERDSCSSRWPWRWSRCSPAMVWRAPTTGRAVVLGLILGGALGNLCRPVVPGRPRRGGRLRRPPLLAHLQRGRRLHRGRVPVAGRVLGPRPPGAVTAITVVGPGVARRRPGGQGGGAGGGPVPLVGRRAGRRGPGGGRRDDGDGAAARCCACGQRAPGSTRRRSRGPGPPEGDPTVVFEVVHEDAEVIVVDKPAGLVVHPGAGHRDRDTGQRVARPLSRPGRSSERCGLRADRARASSTGSTGVPPDCWWWPGRRLPTGRWWTSWPTGRCHAATRPWSSAPWRGRPAWWTLPSGARSAPRPAWPSPARARRPAPGTR